MDNITTGQYIVVGQWVIQPGSTPDAIRIDDISQAQFEEELQSGRTIWPMPPGPESGWNAAEYQAAANSEFDAMGRVNKNYPNYRPILSMLESSFARYSRKAREYRESNNG